MQMSDEQVEKAVEAGYNAILGLRWHTIPEKLRDDWRKGMRAALATLPDAPSLEPPTDVIKAMLDADFAARNAGDWHISSETTRAMWRNGMTAAARVLLNDPRVLGPIRDSEIEVLFRAGTTCPQDFNSVLATRRERLLQPVPDPDGRIKNLLWPDTPSCSPTMINAKDINWRVEEAYKRGLAQGKEDRP